MISIVLTAVGDSTLLTLEHSNVPDDQRSYEEGGWQSNYFEPMVAYFTGLQEAGPAEPREKPAQQSTPKAPPKRAAKRSANTGRKAKPAAKVKSKRAAPRVKAAKKKLKSKATDSSHCCEVPQKGDAGGAQIRSAQTEIKAIRGSRSFEREPR